MTSYEEIIYQADDPVATITLNRWHALNGWTDRMGLEVRHAVAAARPRGAGVEDVGDCHHVQGVVDAQVTCP